jgi:hypothetical protein
MRLEELNSRLEVFRGYYAYIFRRTTECLHALLE